jgi:hypothetical protein
MHYDEGGARAALFGVVRGSAEMRTIETVATVQADGTLMVHVPRDIAPGRHRVVMVIEEDPEPEVRGPLDLPLIDVGKWPEGFTVRRKDLYDDWGR